MLPPDSHYSQADGERRNSDEVALQTVKCQRLTVALEIAQGGFKIGGSRLGINKQKLHQPACCIINVNEKCAGRASLLEPAMLAAINLDQLSDTGMSWTRLMSRGDRNLRGIHKPACIISLRTVSLARYRPWSSASFSQANVGPKSA